MVELGDEEAASYTKQIAEAIVTAGWKIQLTQIGTFSPPQYDVTIGVDDTAQPPLTAKILISAFNKARIAVSLSKKFGITDQDHVELFI